MQYGVLVQPVDPPMDFVVLAQRAEQLGFDYLWVADSSLHGRDVYSYLTLAALDTTRIQLGTGVTHPLTRHPAINVNAIATLHEISGGRAVLGIGAGDRPVLELGLEPAKRQSIEEMVTLSRRLLAGETVTFQGATFDTNEARLIHPPRSMLPIHVAASGPRTLRLAGALADGVLMQVGVHPTCVSYAIGRVAEGVASAGGSDPRLGVVLYGSIREERELARDESRPFAAWIPQTVPMYCDLLGIPRTDVDKIRAAYKGGELMKAVGAAAAVSEEMIEAFTLAGGPRECGEKVDALRTLGIEHVTFFPMGEDRLGGIERFAAAIMR